jgi:hypothetical protein
MPNYALEQAKNSAGSSFGEEYYELPQTPRDHTGKKDLTSSDLRNLQQQFSTGKKRRTISAMNLEHEWVPGPVKAAAAVVSEKECLLF